MAKPLLADRLWERIKSLLPPRPKPKQPDRPGRSPAEDRKPLTGILFVLNDGHRLGEPAPRRRAAVAA